MLDIITGVAAESWHVLTESAPYVLFGLFVAGLLKAFMPDDFVARHLGASSVGSVVKASVLGIPLPLCSCGVVPAAIGLRKQGASKGASTAFLISTPETGVDSIAITYALLDPIMTVLRPVAAFFTATVAGVAVNLLPDRVPAPIDIAAHTPDDGCTCGDTSCTPRPLQPQGFEGLTPLAPPKPPLGMRLKRAMHFAFIDLTADIGPWLLFGIVLAGAIGYFVPAGFIEENLGAGLTPMLLMLVVGVPMYVCATASTPIVAALALKGLSPGAALVFLLAGPVTNIATITVLSRILGRKVALIYVSAIAGVSLLLGLAANAIYASLGLSITRWVQGAAETGPGLFSALMAVALVGLTVFSRLAHKH